MEIIRLRIIPRIFGYLQPKRGLKLMAGPYLSDRQFTNRNNITGLQAGFEAVVNQRLTLVMRRDRFRELYA